jgi:hypothetical protein
MPIASYHSTPLYAQYHAEGGIDGFSQQPTTSRNSHDPHYVLNEWVPEGNRTGALTGTGGTGGTGGTPVFLPPAALWYPQQKGFCNSSATLGDEFDCIETHVRKVNNAIVLPAAHAVRVRGGGEDKVCIRYKAVVL